MTDSDPEPPADEPDVEPSRERAHGTEPDGTRDGDASRDSSRLWAYLDRALLVAFLLLAVVAALQFYLQTGAAIEVWIADEYEPIVKAAFNLAVLLFAAAGLSYQLRRVASDRTTTESGDAAEG